MPRLSIITFTLAALLAACGEKPPTPSKGLVIEGAEAERPYYHDFGLILDGSSPTHTYKLRNTEPRPITLQDVLASCSCVVPEIRVISPTGEVTKGSLRTEDAVCIIPSNGVLQIEVRIDTSRIRRKNTDRLSTIRLRTDSAVTPFHTLELHVKVQQLIQATPWELNLGEVATNEGGTGHVDVIVAVQDAQVNLSDATSLSPELDVAMREELRLGRQLWIVDATLEPGLPLGPWIGSMKLTVDAPAHDPPIRELTIPVRATVVPDIVLRPRRAFIRSGNKLGAQFSAEALIPGARFSVQSATLTGCKPGIYTVEATPIGPDIRGQASTWTISVRPIAERPPGDLDAKLAVKLNDGSVLEAIVLGR